LVFKRTTIPFDMHFYWPTFDWKLKGVNLV
jgi:hypothetical protein